LRALVAHLRARPLSISLILLALAILCLLALLSKLPIMFIRHLLLLRLERLHQSLIQFIIYEDMVIITGLQTSTFIFQLLQIIF